MSMNLTSEIKASCTESIGLGVVAAIFFIIGLPANLLLIWTILRNKALRTSINYLIASLAVCNLSGIIIQLPVFAINAFSCKYVFTHSVCILTAFSLYFSANMNDYILMLICIERFVGI